jgi:hypothetical protein
MSQDKQLKSVQGGTRAMESSMRSSKAVVTDPVWMHALMWIGFPVLGAGAGWLLKAVTGWVVSLPWAPFQGPFKLVDELVASFGEPQATIVAVAIGTVAGLALALVAEQDRLTVTVSGDQVSLSRGESTRRIERASVSAVFLDGKQLVVLGHRTEELTREDSDLDADRLRIAFLTHGYSWLSGGDPYKDEYRLWVEDSLDLPSGADALLKARARALGKGGEGKDDAAELRAELARLGIVVRDERKSQFWRSVGGSETRYLPR